MAKIFDGVKAKHFQDHRGDLWGRTPTYIFWIRWWFKILVKCGSGCPQVNCTMQSCYYLGRHGGIPCLSAEANGPPNCLFHTNWYDLLVPMEESVTEIVYLAFGEKFPMHVVANTRPTIEKWIFLGTLINWSCEIIVWTRTLSTSLQMWLAPPHAHLYFLTG